MFSFFSGLVLGALVVGGLYFAQRRDIKRLDEEKHLLDQEQQIVLDFMHNLVEGIGEGLAREELFQRVAHAAVLSTGSMSACVFDRTSEDELRGVVVEGLFPPQRLLPDASKMKITTRAKFIEQVLRSEVFRMDEGLVGNVAASGEGILINDARSDPRVVRHADPSLTIDSIMLVPIRFREKVLGVVAVANPADGLDFFTNTDFSLLQSLADQAGLAIHNSDIMTLQIEKNKLDQDLALASSIQGMLLPKRFPESAKIDVDARYLPAQKIGGDLYDVFALDEHRIGVAIADVSGKGIPASIIMAICQSNLRQFARNHDSPARVLSELNAVMALEMRPDMFVTVVYAIVDTSKDELTLARAGHELPLVGSVDEGTGLYQTRMFGSEGMALGMVPPPLFNSVISEKTLKFHQGDIFLLCTDGVTEATNSDGAEYTAGRLADVVKLLRTRSASDLNQGILESVSRFSGNNRQNDDITLVTVKHR